MRKLKEFFSKLIEKYCNITDHLFISRDESYHIWLGWKIIIWGFGALVLWACFAPIDKGVTAPGYVISDSNRKTIQSVSSGVVEEIYVKEGESIEAGQLLVKLNEVNAQSQTNATKETIEGLVAQSNGLESAITQKRKQDQILLKQISGMRDLVDEGYLAKNKLSEIERLQLQIKASILEDEGNLLRIRKQVAELKEKLNPYEFDLSNTEIRSPVKGQVVNLLIFTKGGVVGPGSKLMDIAPSDESMLIDAQLPVHLIDKVRVGLPVEMMFTAFNINRTPHIPGVIVSVSGDRIVEEKTGNPYYKIQAKVDAEGQALLGRLKIHPGMPVELFIKTGERSLMSYLLKPILDRTHSALREE
jgi:protease secretion system membrane fusion protein